MYGRVDATDRVLRGQAVAGAMAIRGLRPVSIQKQSHLSGGIDGKFRKLSNFPPAPQSSL